MEVLLPLIGALCRDDVGEDHDCRVNGQQLEALEPVIQQMHKFESIEHLGLRKKVADAADFTEALGQRGFNGSEIAALLGSENAPLFGDELFFQLFEFFAGHKIESLAMVVPW